MNSSEVANPTCTENNQIQVPPRPRKKILFNAFFKNATSNIIGVDEGGAKERRKARDSRVTSDGNFPETSHNCQPSESSKTTNSQNIDGNGLKPNIRNDKQAGNVSTDVENNNNLGSQTAHSINFKKADRFAGNDKRANNSSVDCLNPSVKSDAPSYNHARQNVKRDNNNYQYNPKSNTYQADHFTRNDKINSFVDCPKPSVKSDAPAYNNARQNVERHNNNYQYNPKSNTYQADHFTRNDKRNSFVDCPKPSVKSDAPAYNNAIQNVERHNNNYQFHSKTDTYQANNASQSFENGHNTKCNTSIEIPKEKDSALGRPQISSVNSKDTNDGWGTISECGDYPEDNWGSEIEEDTHKQNKDNDRSKTSSSSKCFQHVEPRNTEAFNNTRQNYTITKKDLTDDRYKDNCSTLQNHTKALLNPRNIHRNDRPSFHADLKPTNRQGHLTETKIEIPKEKDSVLGHPQISLVNGKDTNDGWGTISECGDYPEDNWGSEIEEDSDQQNKDNDRSKTSSSSKCFQHVEPRNTEAFNNTQQNYTITKKDLTDDRYKDNCGSLQNHTKALLNTMNTHRNDRPSSHVELKTTNRQGHLTETKSRGSESKEAYRPKSDLYDSNAHSYQDKNSSKTGHFNFNDRNPSHNAYTLPSSKTKPIDEQNICVAKGNQEPECEGSGWPDLDADKKFSCNDDCSWENSKGNQKEVGREEPKSYQRSYSTPYSNVRRRDGRGDEKDHEFEHENSKMQQEFPKANFNRSSSFIDRTSNRVANRSASAYSTNLSCKTENQFRVDGDGTSISNSEASNWHKTANSDKQADSPIRVVQKLNSLGSSKLTTPSSSNNNDTKVKRDSFLKCVNQSNADDDKWNYISEISTVVLKDRVERERVVERNSMDGLKITVLCHKDPDNIDAKDNQESLKNVFETDDLLQRPFFDPLENDFDFFDNNPDPFIPAPQPPSAFVQLDNTATPNLLSQDEKQSSESQKNAVRLSSSEAMLKGIPDARHILEITLFLTQLESEKSVPLETSQKILKDIIKALDHSSQSSWGKDIVYIYGSYISGLAVSTSNINFAVKTYEEIKSKQANSYLLHMQRGLLNVLKGYQVEPFDEDTNPKKSKICFTETHSGIPCDLGFYNSTVSKYLIMNKMLHNICEFDQRIKTLLVSTRIWAEVCLIHESDEGKLHPVGYSLLMLHFLQGLDKPLLPILNMDSSVKYWGLDKLEEKNESSVGELWLAFLKYYSEFNWGDSVVTVSSNTAVTKSSKSWVHSFIAIEDPFTQENIGDSVVSETCAECIFACFKASYEYFSTPVDYEDSESSDSENSNGFKKEVFSFNHISFDQNIPTVCEKCEELNETCNKCRPRREVIVQPLPELSEASLECVNRTLYDIYNEFRLPEDQREKRIAFVKVLENDVRKVFPGAILKLFGSSVNGFGFKKSDIDICMTFNHKLESNREIPGKLNQIVRFLRRRPNLYENVYGLYHAKIPIVKFHVIQQDWHCDLSLCNILAVHNSKLLRKYSLYDERCCILGCALKLLAKKACMDDTHHLSSYSYILTVIHYLQQVEPPVLPVFPIDHKEVFDENLMIPKEAMDHCNYWLNDKIENLRRRYSLDSKNESSVGQLWLGLLDSFARYDNTYAITITQKEPLPSTNLRRCARLLNIQDPFLEKDNLGCILNDTGADETRKVLTRARLLFGKEIPKEHKSFPKRYFFSSSYLTGRSIKEIECGGCGGFGHQKSECLKSDPFKRSKFKIRVPKARYPRNLKA